MRKDTKKSESEIGLTEAQARFAQDVPLKEWLNTILYSANDKQLIDYQFPTDAHKDEYLATIEQRSEEEVLMPLKHLLIPSCWLGCDESHANWLRDVEVRDPKGFEELMGVQYFKRVFDYFNLNSTDLRKDLKIQAVSPRHTIGF